MKRVLLLITVFIVLNINAQEFEFETETIDYGNVTQGSDGKRVFKFTNVGDSPLIIKQIKSHCPCFLARQVEKPIMPGEKGEIEVRYDTKRLGRFSKSIAVYSNAKRERKLLKSKGSVINMNKNSY